jgi:pyrroline-5-carboxylate reductase
MYNIAIIGAGELGSRHLQGLKLAKVEMSIYVIDPNANSLKQSQERYDQVAANLMVIAISFLSNLNQLPENLDLVIIATSSIVRANVTKSLLE